MKAWKFIEKWSRADLTELAARHEHFYDLCRMLGVQTPAEADPQGEWYCFEKVGRRDRGRGGRADVYKRGYFVWEYKRPGQNMDEAFEQVRSYALMLDSPPVWVVSDTRRIIVRTAWTNQPSRTFDIALEHMSEEGPMELLRWVFRSPEKLQGSDSENETAILERARRENPDAERNSKLRSLRDTVRRFWEAKTREEKKQLRQQVWTVGEPLAEAGDASAQYTLGFLSHDEKKRIEWFARAARQGHAGAQERLGSHYDRTDAQNPEDTRLAAYWYEKAAEQGIASAQVRIGICYMEGKGVERDPTKGFRWYLRAAENDPEGNTAAKVLIGKAYTDGQGTEVDYATAVKWFLRSTNDKHVGWAEHIYLTVMFETGLGVERDPERAAEHRRASYRHPVVEKHPQYRREVDELHEKMLKWAHRMVERLP